MAGPYDYTTPLAQAESLPQPQEGASILGGISDALKMRYSQFQNAFNVEQNQRTMALQQQQDAAQQTALANPTPENIQAWQIAAPDQWQATQAAHNSLNTDTQRTNMQDAAAVYGLLDAGNTDGAAKVLQNRIDAGQTHLQPLLDMVQSGDPGKVKSAQGVAGMTLASYMGPDQFANVYGSTAKTPSEIALNQANANKANKDAQYRTIDNTQGVIDLGAQTGSGTAPASVPGQTGQSAAPSDSTGAAAPVRGVRNNNPVNVTNLASGQWAGQKGSDGQYAVFSTPQAGWAAADKNLQAYATQHGINTVAGIVSRWAPESAGNNTAAYIGSVAGNLNVDPNQPLDLSKPQVRQQVLQAMSKVELAGQSIAGGAQAQPPPSAVQGAPPSPGAANVQGSGPQVVAAGPGFSGSALAPRAIEQYAQQYVADGSMPDLGRTPMAGMQKAAIINRAAEIEAANGQTGYDVAARRAAVASNEKALDSVTQQANAMHTSEQTVLKNMQLVTTLSKQGGGPTGSPLMNMPIQDFRKNVLGSNNVAAFDEAIGSTADEFATYIGKGTPSVSGRQDAQDRLDKSATVGQLMAVMGTMRQQMGNQASSYDDQRSALIGSVRSGITSTGAALPQLKSPAEMKKLPSGTAFLTPDGRMMVTP